MEQSDSVEHNTGFEGCQLPTSKYFLLAETRPRERLSEHQETSAPYVENKGRNRTPEKHLLLLWALCSYTTEVRCITYKRGRGQAARSSFRKT